MKKTQFTTKYLKFEAGCLIAISVCCIYFIFHLNSVAKDIRHQLISQSDKIMNREDFGDMIQIIDRIDDRLFLVQIFILSIPILLSSTIVTIFQISKSNEERNNTKSLKIAEPNQTIEEQPIQPPRD